MSELTSHHQPATPTLIASLRDHAGLVTTLTRRYTVIQHTTVADILKAYHNERIPLLVVDDVDLCRQLRSDVSIPILVVGTGDDSDDALSAGANDYMRLPISDALVLRRVDCLIKSSSFYSYDQLPTMIHAVNRAREIVYVNTMWLQIMGYTADEVIGRDIFDLMSEESRDRSIAVLSTFWDHEQTRDNPYTFFRKDGKPIHVLLDSDVIIDARGERLSLSVARDVTELRQAQERLRTSEDQLYTVLNALTDAIFVLNRAGEYVRVLTPNNEALLSNDGRTDGQSLLELMSEDNARRLQTVIDAVLRDDGIHSLEYRVSTDDGLRWYLATTSPLPGREEVVFVVRDVTDRKNIELSLQDSEERYRRLFESANDGIFLVDLKSASIIESNKQFARMLGYSPDELIGKPIDDIEIAQELDDDTSRDFARTQRLIIEATYLRRDGSRIPVETSSRIITYTDRPTLLCFVREISERKRALYAEQDQRNLAEMLRDTAAAFNQAISLDDALDTLIDTLARIVAYDTVNIMVISDDDQTHVARHRGYHSLMDDRQAIETARFAIDSTENLRQARDTSQAVVIYETTPHLRQQGSMLDEQTRSMLTIPIVVEGVTFGFINLESRRAATFNQEHANRIQTLANQAAIAIHKAQLFTQVEEYAESLERRIADRTADLITANEQLQAEIDQRQQVEKQLESEQQLLKTLIETIPDAIYVKDRNSRFIMANAATIAAMNLTSATDLMGKSDFDFVSEPEARRHYEDEQRIMQTGRAMVNSRDIHETSDGQTQHKLITKVPLRAATGEITGIIGINHDITRWKETEEQLEHILTSARCLLYYATVERQDDGTYTWNVQVANVQAARTFLPMNVTHQTYTDAWRNSIPREDQERREVVFDTHVSYNKFYYSQEFRCQLDDKSVAWLVEDVHIQAETDNKWRIVGVCTDISQRKQAQERLQQINDELEHRVNERTDSLVQANETLRREISVRRRAEEEERKQRILAEALRDNASMINSTLKRDEIFAYLLDSMEEVIPFDSSNIMLLDGMQAQIVNARGYDASVDIIGRAYDINQLDNLRTAYETHDPFIIPDISAIDYWEDDDMRGWLRSHLCAPIPNGERIIGFLNLGSHVRNHFTVEHAEYLQAFAHQAGVAIRNAQLVDRLEERVAQRTSELAYERAQLQAILNAMRDGVVFQDLAGKPHYINRAMSAITGYTADEWRSGSAQEGLNHESIEKQQATWQDVKTHLTEQGYWQGETTLVHKDGHVWDASLIRSEVRDADGNNIGIVTVMRDITQSKRLDEQKARFIASASHELRTPIANMKTRLFLMRRQPERLHEHLEVAESVANLMQQLIENLFDVSRFERGVITLNREPVILQNLIRETMRYQEPEAERQAIALVSKIPDEPLRVHADPYRLTQVMTNLIKNALNYTPENGRVTVELTRTNESIRLTVSDTGQGIKDEHMSMLFTPFFRGQTDNLGAGLGLSISHEIIKLHGGSIHAESTYGEGSRFIVDLPIAIMQATAEMD